jgi:O-antigen/teichoic acid export membrane protein
MFKKIIETIFVKGLSSIINFLIVVITAYYLGKYARGEISILLVSVSLINIIQGIVGGPSLIYLASKYSNLKLFIYSFIWNFLIALVFSFIIAFLDLTPFRLIEELFLISFLQGGISIFQSLLVGHEQISKHNLIEFSKSIFLIVSIAICFLLFNEKNLDAVYLSYIVSFSLAAFIGLLYIGKYLSFKNLKNNKKLFFEMFMYGFQNQINNFSQLLNYRYLFYLIEKWKGIEVLGVFSISISIIESVWVICKGISTNLLAKLVNEKDESMKTKYTLNSIKLSLFLSIIATSILLIIPSDFYSFIFGKDFTEVKSHLLPLSITILSFSVLAIISQYYASKGQLIINLRASFLGNIFCIGMGWFLIKSYSVHGAILTYNTVNLIMMFYLIYQFNKSTKTKIHHLLFNKNDFTAIRKKF